MSVATDLLKSTLSISVPLYIHEFRRLSHDDRMKHIEGAISLLCERADLLIYKGQGKEGETVRIFNTLAKCIAVMAFVPGGITSFGLHFEVTTEGDDHGEEESV